MSMLSLKDRPRKTSKRDMMTLGDYRDGGEEGKALGMIKEEHRREGLPLLSQGPIAVSTSR